MSATLGRKAKKDRVWIKAGYAPALLKAIQHYRKEGEKIQETVSRLISQAVSQLNQTKR
jgi:hypothetical protein